MWFLSAANKNGDTYHESFKTLDEVFEYISNTIGEENLARLKISNKVQS